MDDYDDITGETPIRKADVLNLPDSHLQSAIRKDNRLLFTKLSTQKTPRLINDLRNMWRGDVLKLEIDSERWGCHMMSLCFDADVEMKKWVVDNLSDTHDTVLNHIISHINNILPLHSKIDYRKSPSEKIIRAYSYKMWWDMLRINMQNLADKQSKYWSSEDSPHPDIVDVTYCQKYAIMTDTSNQSWLLDYDQIMMLSDTISARVFVYYYYETLPSSSLTYINPSILIQLYTYFDQCVIDRGNDGYNEVKCFEPIIQGVMLSEHDILSYSGKFLYEIRKDLENSKYNYALSLLKYVESHHFSVYQLGELFGLNRHWGHPTVNEEAGCLKVQKIAKSRPPPKIKKILHMVALLKKQFCLSFISAHGRWPRIDTSSMSKYNPLRDIILSKKTYSPNYYSEKFKISVWSEITFKGELEFDYYLDFTALCDDTAIAPYLQDLPCIYSPDILGYTPPKPKSSRRVLIEMLRRETIDIKEICKKVMMGEIPEDWKIIILHSKEREVKIDPRLFAMMVLEMRIYFCVTEKNLAEKIFPYFPQQTMTLSEIELTKRLISLSNTKNETSFIPVYASIDFKSWNIHWQISSTHYFFEVLDCIFDTPGLYVYSHEFFRTSTVVLSSYYNPPDSLKNPDKNLWFTQGDKLWRDHDGGFEGIRQKGWTLITICLLLYTESITGIKAYIIGQGDNQICKLMIPKRTRCSTSSNDDYIKANQKSLTNMIEEYLSILELNAGYLSLVIKKEESWVSHRIVNYGKEILFQGAYLSQSIKRISRIIPDVNDGYPTIPMVTATLQTAGMSASQKGYDIYLPYLLCQIETLMTLRRSSKHSLIIRRGVDKELQDWIHTRSAIEYVLHLCTELDGFPITNLYSYLYRGHPDSLTTYFSFIYNNIRNCKLCGKIYTYYQKRFYKLGPGEPELLISNPLAINIDSPQQISSKFSDYMKSTIKTLSKNIWIKDVFHSNCEKEDKELYNYLIASKPIYPRFLHEIMRLSPTGTRLSIISMFSNTRTLKDVSSKSVNYSFMKVIKNVELQIYKFISEKHLEIMLIKTIVELPWCPTKLAQDIRDFTWRHAIRGKIQGVTIPYPLHQLSINYLSTTSHATCIGDPENMMFRPIQYNGPIALGTRGPYTPFLGSVTREKQTGKILQLTEISRPLMAAQRLVQLEDWCIHKGSNITAFIDNLIRLRTNVPKDLLILSTGAIYSGSQVHRINDHITKRSTLNNFRPNSASHIYFSSDDMGRFSRGSDNYNIHFQGAIHTGLSLLHLSYCYNIEIPFKFVHLHISCQDCIMKIPDDRIENEYNTPTLSTSIGNPLIYAQTGRIPKLMPSEFPYFRLVKSSTLAEAAASLIFSRIVSNIANNMWGTSEKTSVSRSSVSIQELCKIGIKPILDKLAMYLFLYFHGERYQLEYSIIYIQNEIWRELGNQCLLPEVICDLYRSAGETAQSQLFEINSGCIRMINKALLTSLKTIRDQVKNKTLPSITFFPLPGCNITKILNMWMCMIKELSDENTDLSSSTSHIEYELKVGMNLPTNDSLSMLYDVIKSFRSENLKKLCFSTHPLKMSTVPPESVLGVVSSLEKKKLMTMDKEAPSTIKNVKLENSSCYKLIQVSHCERITIDMDYISGINKVHPTRTYSDHQFGLRGTLSCSYLKTLQLLGSFGISVDGNCVCLADGDGGISRLLINLGAHKIWFNTLINPEKLIPQRGVSFIPASCIDVSHKIEASSLSALMGGDITNKDYLESFLCLLPDSCKVLTMDAESDCEFSPGKTLELINSSLMCCVKTSSKYAILKTYCQDSLLMTNIIGLVNTIYESVFVVVPTFSSHENYEVFIVATNFNPITNLTWNTNYKITQAQRSTIGAMEELAKSRLSNRPLQEQCWTSALRVHLIWKVLIYQAYQLNIKLNLSHNIELIMNHRIPYHEENVQDLNGWCDETIAYMSEMIESDIIGLSKSLVAEPVTTTESIMTASNTAVNNTLTDLAIIQCNLLLLKGLLNISPSHVNIFEYIHLNKNKYITLKYQDKPIFTAYSISEHYPSKYIKAFWRIYGHLRYSNEVNKNEFKKAWNTVLV